MAEMAIPRKPTVRDLVIFASILGVTVYDGEPVNVFLEEQENCSLLDLHVWNSGLVRAEVERLFEKPGSLIAIVSRNGTAEHYLLPSNITIGDLKVALGDCGGMVGTNFVGREFLTGTRIKDDETPLWNLTTLQQRNVCLDIIDTDTKSGQVGKNDSISQHIFRKHLKRSRFQRGVDRGLWRLESVRWPEAWIALRRPEEGSDEAVIYFRLDQYPASAPLIALWDEHRNNAIGEADQWPSWFKSFIVAHYPAFADIYPPTYSPAVLRMSQLVARRLRKNQCGSWISSGDITQTLERLLRCFRSIAAPGVTDQQGVSVSCDKR
jgi:hypothetical protein